MFYRDNLIYKYNTQWLYYIDFRETSYYILQCIVKFKNQKKNRQ